MTTQREEIRLATVDVASLPSLAEIFGRRLDAIWREEIRRLVANVQDTKTAAETERSITFVLAFEPEADRTSMAYRLKRHDLKLAGSIPPMKSRMTFATAGTIKVFDRSSERIEASETEKVPSGVLHPENIPSLAEIWNGALDSRFRRCLAQIALNIDDPATDPRAVRTLTITMAFKADEDRQSMGMRLSKISLKLAPPRSPDPVRLYMELCDGEMFITDTIHHPNQTSLIPSGKAN